MSHFSYALIEPKLIRTRDVSFPKTASLFIAAINYLHTYHLSFVYVNLHCINQTLCLNLKQLARHALVVLTA